jgi:hypothetical protein
VIEIGLRGRTRAYIEIAVILGLAFITITISIAQEDVKFWDESSYLERGQQLGFGSQPGWEWNPLYTDGYWTLSRILPDGVTAYFAGRAISATLLVLAVWWTARLFTRRGIAASAGLLMCLLPITYIWPGVCNPSAALLIASLAIAWRWRRIEAYAVAANLIWLAAAIRPEFVYAGALATTSVIVVAVIQLRSQTQVSKFAVLAIASSIALPLLLTWAYGNPYELGTRSWEAFTQHYEYRFAQSGDDPWQISSPVIETTFPGATSVLGALQANPAALLQHAILNAVKFPVSLVGHFCGLGGTTLPATVLGVSAAFSWLAGCAVAVATSLRRVGLRRSLERLRPPGPAQIPMALSIFVIGTALLSALVIYPRPHYLGIFIGLLVVLSAISLNRLGDWKVTQLLPSATLAGLALVALLLSLGSAFACRDSCKPVAKSLNALNNVSVDWKLLAVDQSVDVYLTRGGYVSEATGNAGTFAQVLQKEGVNLVYDGFLFRRGPWSILPDFPDFLANPSAFGFQPILPGSPFLVKGVVVNE